MEKCLSQMVRILKIKLDGQTETLLDRIGTVVDLIEEILGVTTLLCYRPTMEPNKGYTTTTIGKCTKTTRLSAGHYTATRFLINLLEEPRREKGECYTVQPPIKNTWPSPSFGCRHTCLVFTNINN